MQFNNSVNTAEILNRGFKNFKSTFKPFFKYALLAVIVSYSINLYVAFMDTFFFNHEVLYITGIVLLVLLFLPIAYYTIRLNMTAAGKLKGIIEGQPFDFRQKLKDSKHEFWRLFFVLAAKFFLKVVMIVCMLPLTLLLMSKMSSVDPKIGISFRSYVVLPATTVAMFILYLLTRLEFASLVIYWNVDTEYSDLDTSMKMTKKHYLKKLMIIIVAHIPNLLVNGVMFLNFVNNYGSSNIMLKWIYVVGMVLLNGITLSWPLTFYHSLFMKMKAFTLSEDVLVDDEGKEWLTF